MILSQCSVDVFAKSIFEGKPPVVGRLDALIMSRLVFGNTYAPTINLPKMQRTLLRGWRVKNKTVKLLKKKLKTKTIDLNKKISNKNDSFNKNKALEA